MTIAQRFESIPKSPKRNRLPENPEKAQEGAAVGPGRFPSWLHRKLPQGGELWETTSKLRESSLSTVCEEAKCPNRLECFSRGTATYLVMGSVCTRACGFCEIDFAKNPAPLQADEPERLLQSCRDLNLKHVVITMVARDDLPDGGAAHLATMISLLHREEPNLQVEVLTSDFQGNLEAVDMILAAGPTVFNHNLETVRRLSPTVRHKATYERSLSILRHVHENSPDLPVKSGIMVGLGETDDEVREVLHDLKDVGCSIVTMGQYLQPSRKKLAVKSFVHPDKFKEYEDYGRSIGIGTMFCGPFVRSSYHAAEVAKPSCATK